MNDHSNPRAAEPLGLTPEQAAAAESDAIVFTAGVSSAVLDNGDCVGHILLLDCDHSNRITIYNAAAAMQGITAVFESSPGSFHIWNLTVREWEQAILEGLSWSIADSEHVAQSYRRGRYVLRFVGKVDSDGERYKQPPKLLDVFCNFEGDAETVGPQSIPHIRRLVATADEQGVDIDLPEPAEIRTAGTDNGLCVDRYMTLTDAAKDSLRPTSGDADNGGD